MLAAATAVTPNDLGEATLAVPITSWASTMVAKEAVVFSIVFSAPTSALP